MVRHNPLQVYERQLCLSCIAGIYGCRWKRYERSQDDSTKWELLWSLILLLTFCLLLVWFYFWWEADNDYNEFNWFLYNRSGQWSDGTIPILATSAASLTYIALLTVLFFCHIAFEQQLYLHKLHKIGVTVALIATVAGVITVNRTWSQEWDIIPISLQATGPFLHIGALAAVTALSWVMARYVARSEKTMFQVVVMLLYISALVSLYVAPLYIASPCIMDPAALKPRPEVIGHQGAPMLAPENTLWSFQRALQMNVTGLEADVAISLDGVPFLMRDRTLQRTTNVALLFPERNHDDASFFNWTQLRSLNAGSWFLKDDPFWTVSSLSPHERSLIDSQSVCSLEQLLKLASYHNTSVVFRLRKPPPDHPHHHSWINDTLKAVNQSGVPQSLVMWTPDEQRAEVRQQAPGLIQTSLEKLSPQSLQESNISRLLLRYNRAAAQEVRDFSSGNISLMLYTVNEPWLYSVLWCSNVASVSSEAPQILKKVPYPIWLLSPDEYFLMWMCADFISFAVVVAVFIIQRYRMSCMNSYNPEQIVLTGAVHRSSRNLNVMREKLIFSEVGNGVGSADDLQEDMGDYDYYNRSVGP